MPRVLIGLTILAVLVQLIRPALPQAFGRLTPDEPIALVDRLAAELPADGCCARVLNEQVWGGYLAYRLSDRVRTAMDGRLEIRSGETWSEYFDLLHGEGDPARQLGEAGVEWALVGADRNQLLAALDAAGWQVVERSPHGVLLRAPT
ncbi:MAG: hypothetical protein H0W10_06830 [Chloroflexi bacterium]|nr:hypothetical protein [Chloroflexota bacterium]